MLLGTSISHVNQGPGLCYSKEKIEGYYNDLTEKVLKREDVLKDVPSSLVDSGERIFFSIEIFQYGLGACDLYLLSKSAEYLRKACACAKWAVKNQDAQGRWVTFAYKHPEMPYSSMAQAEAISLLIRVKRLTNCSDFDSTIHRAFEYMIMPIEKGGTAKYEGEQVYFYESPASPLILNGWIFSIWGIWDYVKEYGDSKAKEILRKTLRTLETELPNYDMKYWSKYGEGKRVASPFYHDLHIAQLKTMFDLTGNNIYKIYAEKWLGYKRNTIFRNMAFVKKTIQKILEP